MLLRPETQLKMSELFCQTVLLLPKVKLRKRLIYFAESKLGNYRRAVYLLLVADDIWSFEMII